jgi:hypothetical protein
MPTGVSTALEIPEEILVALLVGPSCTAGTYVPPSKSPSKSTQDLPDKFSLISEKERPLGDLWLQ